MALAQGGINRVINEEEKQPNVDGNAKCDQRGRIRSGTLERKYIKKESNKVYTSLSCWLVL